MDQSQSPAPEALRAFLKAHALPQAVPAVLTAHGESLYHRLSASPPPVPEWGRFLVALGHLAAETIDDPTMASRYFLQAVRDLPLHGDTEAAITAGYDQGVLFERSGRMPHARAAYRAAATLGVRTPPLCANGLRAAMAHVRMEFAEGGVLSEPTRALLKQAWLGWLFLRHQGDATLDAELIEQLQRSLCAFLLPEEDPGSLAAHWRSWAPSGSAALPDDWTDGATACLAALYAASAEAADRHLADEGPDPGHPYRLLLGSLKRGGRS